MLDRRLWSLGLPQKRLLALAAAVGVAITATYAGQGVLVALVLDAVTGGSGGQGVWLAAGGIAILQLLRIGLLRWREEVAMEAAGRIKADVRDELYEKVLELGPSNAAGSRTGEVQTTLLDAVEHLEPFFARYVPILISSVISATALAAVILFLDWPLGLIVLVSVAIVPLGPRLVSRLLSERSDQWSADYRRLYSESLDGLQGMPTLLAFNANRRWADDMDARAGALARSATRLTATWGFSEAIVGLAGVAGTAVAVALGALRVASGDMGLAELFVVLMLTRECFRPLTDLRRALHSAYPIIASSVGLFQLLDARPDVRDGEGEVEPSRHDIDFDEVVFGYLPDHAPVVDSVSFRVAEGEKLAIVGPSGSGKTTLVSLLLRFFDTDSGTISIGGVDIRSLDLSALRDTIALVSQDTYLFHDTVRNNLTLGLDDVDETRTEAALEAASAGFVRGLPEGLETVVGERGVKLSGGERQRLAIARALIKDAPILVLDEPTSAVDAANEAGIQEALQRLARGRTTIVIAHRLSTIRDADRILVLDSGKVVESGSHDDLTAVDGPYSRLVAAQVAT